MSDTICFVVGARPNFMKAAPVFQALEQLGHRHLLLVHTGQHYDPEMSAVFLDELGLPSPNEYLGIGSASHGEQTARALVGVEKILLQQSPRLVVVAGDVNSTLAAALAAVKLRIPVAHIESGLRSFDETMPEEHNRRLTDHLSAILLVHSESAVANLEREGIDPGRIHFVGNTMIDSLLKHLPRALELRPWRDFALAERSYALVTLHRPSLVDSPELLHRTMTSLQALARELPVVFPVHPRTRARLAAIGLEGDSPGERLVLAEPLGYLAFLGLEARAALVITDSGGIQEETSALGVPCFTLRDSTERPITTELGTNVLLRAHPERILEIPRLPKRRLEKPIPYWDGKAGRRAAEVLRRFVRDKTAMACDSPVVTGA